MSFQVIRVERCYGSSLDAFLELNGGKIPLGARIWVKFAKAEEFASETHVFEFT